MKTNNISHRATGLTIPIIKIGFNEEWETDNWYCTICKKPAYGLRSGRKKWKLGDIPKDIPKLVTGVKGNKDKKALKILRRRLQKALKEPALAALLNQTIEEARSRWRKVNKRQFFTLLAQVLDVPLSLFCREYRAYFTFSTRYPFHGSSFMFGKHKDFADLAMHEIMHIEFLKAYTQYCKDKGLDDAQVGHLKEILTVLLNEDAKHLLSRPDLGYTKHLLIRPKVLRLYRKGGGRGGDFRLFLDKVIELIRQSDF